MKIPFGNVYWEKNIISPFISQSGQKQHWDASQSGVEPTLRCHIRKLNMMAADRSERILFDHRGHNKTIDLHCVVLGREKTDDLSQHAEHFVLVIKPTLPLEFERYARVGVGRVLFEHMSGDLGVFVIT